MKFIRRLAVVFVALVAVALAGVKILYGGGTPYPDVSTSPLYDFSKVEALVKLDFPPGNVGVSDGGRVFFSYHPFANAQRFSESTLFELVDGTPKAFPSTEFQKQIQGVFGMYADRQNRLWVVEPASLDHANTLLRAFDLTSNTLVFDYSFPSGEAKFAQDLRVSPDGNTVYLADTGLFRFTSPALYVFDVPSKSYSKRLTGDQSAQPQNWLIQTAFGNHRLGFGLVTFAVGLDGIALSADGGTLYYGAMSHDTLYAVPTSALRDSAISDAKLAESIKPVGKKPLSDGIILDQKGRILITDFEHGGLARMEQDGRLQTLFKSPSIIWADGVVVAPDGSVLMTDSAIPAYIDQLARPPSEATLAAHRPYTIYRLPPQQD